MRKPEFLAGRKDGKTRRNAAKHNKEYATVTRLRKALGGGGRDSPSSRQSSQQLRRSTQGLWLVVCGSTTQSETSNKAMQESYSAKCACITVAPAKSTDSKSVAD